MSDGVKINEITIGSQDPKSFAEKFAEEVFRQGQREQQGQSADEIAEDLIRMVKSSEETTLQAASILATVRRESDMACGLRLLDRACQLLDSINEKLDRFIKEKAG